MSALRHRSARSLHGLFEALPATLSALALLLGASACSVSESTPKADDDEDRGSSDPEDDQGSEEDEGSSEGRRDSGTKPSDAGSKPSDAGAKPSDAGTKPSDAGSKPTSDAGSKSDASTPPRDAGSEPGIDAGRSDAGTTSDAGATSDAGTVTPGKDGFPRSDEAVNTARTGPYQVGKYTEGLANRAYNSAIMYYPTDARPPFAAVAFSPGFTATKESYEKFLGPLLASHGIALLLTTPTSTSDFPPERGKDLEAALEQIKAENTRDGSPLKGKLALDRLAVTGHSMGGGGTLWAANTLGDKIKCAVPLQPWQPGQAFAKIAAPTLFIVAQNDTVAGNAQNSSVHYKSIPASVPKYFVEFAGASHFLTTNDLGTQYDGQSKYMIAFYKAYLEDDARYRAILDADKDAYLSKYEHTP